MYDWLHVIGSVHGIKYTADDELNCGAFCDGVVANFNFNKGFHITAVQQQQIASSNVHPFFAVVPVTRTSHDQSQHYSPAPFIHKHTTHKYLSLRVPFSLLQLTPRSRLRSNSFAFSSSLVPLSYFTHIHANTSTQHPQIPTAYRSTSSFVCTTSSKKLFFHPFFFLHHLDNNRERGSTQHPATPIMTSTMKFALGLLQRVSESTKAAQEAERQKQREAAAARAKAAQLEQEKEKQRIREEADRMIDRNTRSRKKAVARKRASAEKKEKKQMTPEQVALKMRGVAPKKEEGVARGKIRKPVGPPKPLPGMEFVVRKSQKKEIKVPHTSDYSDMFGDKYLVGIDVKCVQDMKKKSAQATKEAQRIIAERKEKAERLLKEAEESRKKDEEAARMGIKRDKNEWRKKAAEREYISVDKPLSMMTPAEREMLLRQAERDNTSSPVGPSSSSASASGVARGRISKNVAKVASAKEVAKRKAALRDRILAATGGAKPKPNSVRSPSQSPERRPSSTGMRRRPMDDRDSYRTDRHEYVRRQSPRRSRCEEEERGYNSEEWSGAEDGSDSDDSEDLYGIDALDREEERSSRLAKLEDKRERMRELKHQKEKERRRREFERSRR